MESPVQSEVEDMTDSAPRCLTKGKSTEAPGDMGLEGISLQERLFREVWRGWEESLRMARRHQQLREVVAKLPISAKPTIIMQRLAEDEEARLKVWRTWFLEQAEGFEEEGMEMGEFGLDG